MKPADLVAAASASYAANCALGVSVACGMVQTGRARWVHHALYVCTSALTVSALVSLAATRDRAGLLLLPTLLPLALIPSLGTRTVRHPLVSLSAAPFYLATLARTRR